MAENKSVWPSVDEQLSAAKVVRSSALEALRALQAVPPELADNAIKANQAVVDRLLRSSFDYATQDALLELVREAEKIKPGQPRKGGSQAS